MAANSVITGCQGSVTTTNFGARIASFSLSLIHEVYDATGFDSNGYRQNLGGLKSATGVFAGFLTYGSVQDQPGFNELGCGDTGVTIILTAKTGCYYTFTANISKIDIDERVDDNAKIAFSFVSTGPIVESWLS